MKKFIPITIVSILALAACNDNAENSNEESHDGTQQMATHATQYECDSGKAIDVSYTSNETAKVTYQGQDYAMTIAVSASGARYIGERFEWWVKGAGTGAEGNLFSHNADGTTGEKIERCTEVQ